MNEQINIPAKEPSKFKRLSKNPWVLTVVAAVVLIGGASTFATLKIAQGRIYTDKAMIEAAQTGLAPQTAGVLEDVSVSVGDFVDADTVVARVGNELIKTKVAGTISAVNNDIGKLFNRGEAVVSMFEPSQLRVVGRIDEDGGISDVRIGQRAVFTADAFGSKKYDGVVDEISPVSRESGIVFSISDKRETKQYDVKVRFDAGKYPELKNGMSAKLWIYR